MATIGLAEVRMSSGVFVHITASVGVLRRSFAKPMNVHNAQTVVSVGKAGRRPQPVRNREGDVRRKHAKHMD